MTDQDRTNKELIEKVSVLQKRIHEMEQLDSDRKRLDEEGKLHSKRLAVLNETGLSLISELNLAELLDSIVKQALNLLGGASCTCYLYNPQTDLLERVATAGTPMIPGKKTRRLGEGLVGHVWLTGMPLVVNDYRAWSGRMGEYDSFPSRALIAVPFRAGTDIIGVLNIMAHLPHQYTQADAEMLNLFATQAAIAIRNARVFDQMNLELAERKRAEEALRESEEQFKAIFQMASIGMAQADPKTGRWLRVNQKMCEITGYASDEMLALHITDLTHPEDRGLDWQSFQNVVNGKSPNYRLEKRYIRKDGTIVWVNVNMTVIRDFMNHPMRTVATIEDITARKQADEERVKLQDQLLQSQKMESVGRLAGGIAHDFNNMLGVIIGHTEMALKQVGPAQPLQANLQEILKAAERSSDLTRQLLAFARRQTVSPKVLDLNETLAALLKMLQRLIGEEIHLSWLPSVNLWPVKIDPSQIDQILANLCVNARDAIAGGGKVFIETENISFDEVFCCNHPGFVPGEYVLLAISDNGCGMNKEILDKLFEPFFTTKGVGKGTGLGLATVYGIIKQNNGFINVYSEPGQGTTFKIYLPRHVGKAEEAQREGPQEPAIRGQETVLVAEDEPAILEMTKIMLESQGYTVVAASTPGEAIRLAREYAGDIHLLMTDVVMPEMNGRDLAKNLLSLYPHLKRLFMSGYTADVIAHHGVLDEGVYFIQKPFSMNSLAVKVREALDHKLS